MTARVFDGGYFFSTVSQTTDSDELTGRSGTKEASNFSAKNKGRGDYLLLSDLVPSCSESSVRSVH